MNVLKTSLFATALVAAGISSANAATADASFGVQLVVQNACTITAGGTAADMDFATVSGNITADIDASTDLTVNCNNGAIYKIGLDDGVNATAGQRRMTSAATGQFVNYNLYLEAGRTTRWDALTGTNTYSSTGSNADQTVTVYGRVPGTPTQSVGAGTYNDTVTATIEF